MTISEDSFTSTEAVVRRMSSRLARSPDMFCSVAKMLAVTDACCLWSFGALAVTIMLWLLRLLMLLKLPTFRLFCHPHVCLTTVNNNIFVDL